MKELFLITKEESRPSCPKDVIPAGTMGRVIDIMIDNGRAMFLLEFEDTVEWYATEELEECDTATN